jgi:MoxR-like ATPase
MTDSMATGTPGDGRIAGAEAELAERLTRDVLGGLKQAFVGKDEIVDLLGVSLIAGENLFLLGPPGTAKSAIVHELARRLEGRVFDYLLTRFTEPNELFGPFDIRRLREGDLVTNTEGMLPEASFVFLDELLNANSAILNSLLLVLNERIFRRGRETRALPVLMVVGASNRLPEDEALGALFDRFLLRVRCDNVGTEHLAAVLDAGWRLDLHRRRPEPVLHLDDVRRLHRRLPDVDVTPVRERYVELVHRLRHAGIAVSDRRAVKLQRLVAASALACGRLAAHASDLWVLRYAWDTEEQIEVLASIVDDALARAPADEGIAVHPRSAGADRPDPERIAEDLERIESRLADGTLAAAERSFLRDRLSQLASRVGWIPGETQRTFLSGRIEALLGSAGGAS